MPFPEVLTELADPESHLLSAQLVDFSNLDEFEARELLEAWDEIPLERRVRLLSDITDLAQDNVELNFDAVYKTALTDETPELRVVALRGLFEYEGRDLIDALTELVREDPDPDVRRESAIALGRFALQAELGYLRDGDTEQIKDSLIESVEDDNEDERVRARSLEALGAISGEDVENLIESLYQEDNIWLKVGAMDAMGRSCNDTWLPLVYQEMENPAPEMRHAAAFAAGEIGDEDAIERLKEMSIQDPDRDVQLVAIHALAEIGGPMARVALKSILYEGDDELREAVEEAMSEIAFNDDPLSPTGF
jgi:HEAT repeat protein